jgi:hypothetical protein
MDIFSAIIDARAWWELRRIKGSRTCRLILCHSLVDVLSMLFRVSFLLCVLAISVSILRGVSAFSTPKLQNTVLLDLLCDVHHFAGIFFPLFFSKESIVYDKAQSGLGGC